MREVRAHLEAAYGGVYAFEHGPWAPNRTTGCSVDHAHVHLVPMSVDLLAVAQPFMPDSVVWRRASWADAGQVTGRGLDYLYVEEPSGRGMIATAPEFGSQILRKALAVAVGLPKEFDWREHPKYEEIERTIRRVSESSLTATAV